MSLQIIKAERDHSDGILLTTTDKWLIEDLCETIARAVSPKALVQLAMAIQDFRKDDALSATELDLARHQISTQIGNKPFLIARLLPYELHTMIEALQKTLDKTA
jgi:HPt (histidine-containing phosphotransfer) domain-containing protein